MSEEQKAPEEEVEEGQQEEETPKDSVTNADDASIVDQHLINPMTELLRSMKAADETCRTTMAGLKRLFKQSKGRGQASLTEIMQLFSALYSLHHIGQNQSLIVSNQVTSDLDRQRLHLRALQEFLIEFVAPFKMDVAEMSGDEEEVKNRLEEKKQECRDRIDELYTIEKEKMAERRKAAVEKHKEKILDGALKDMQREPLKKEEPKKEDGETGGESKIIALP